MMMPATKRRSKTPKRNDNDKSGGADDLTPIELDDGGRAFLNNHG